VAQTEFLETLQSIIATRLAESPDDSYTARLAAKGTAKVAQKVGEEAVELVLAAVGESDERVTAEAADLVFHLLVLLALRGVTLEQLVAELARRHAAKRSPS
jgi:phosphoribosyl-ATP pyrophosphohydrolase